MSLHDWLPSLADIIGCWTKSPSYSTFFLVSSGYIMIYLDPLFISSLYPEYSIAQLRSAALGLAVSAAVAYGYSNIFVTVSEPSRESCDRNSTWNRNSTLCNSYIYIWCIYIYMILKQNIYVDVLNLSIVYCIYIYIHNYIL